MTTYFIIHLVAAIIIYRACVSRFLKGFYYPTNFTDFVVLLICIILAPIWLLQIIAISTFDGVYRITELQIKNFAKELEKDYKASEESLTKDNLIVETRRMVAHKRDYQKHIYTRFKHKFNLK